MTNLTAAAQAVLDATYVEMDYAPRRHVQWAAAAALRAAADQVVPENAEPVGDEHDDARHFQWMRIRWQFLAIAAELEANEL